MRMVAPSQPPYAVTTLLERSAMRCFSYLSCREQGRTRRGLSGEVEDPGVVVIALSWLISTRGISWQYWSWMRQSFVMYLGKYILLKWMGGGDQC